MLMKILPGSTQWGNHRHPWGDAISRCNQSSECQRPNKIKIKKMFSIKIVIGVTVSLKMCLQTLVLKLYL